MARKGLVDKIKTAFLKFILKNKYTKKKFWQYVLNKAKKELAKT